LVKTDKNIRFFLFFVYFRNEADLKEKRGAGFDVPGKFVLENQFLFF
jgi:hypothetical protein